MIKMIQKNMNKKGFTLVELIIVIAVMAILAAIVIPRMSGITESFREKADERSCETIARELEIRIQMGTLTPSTTLANADVVITDGSIDAPRTGGTFQYIFDANGADASDTSDDNALTVQVTPSTGSATITFTVLNVEKIDQ